MNRLGKALSFLMVAAIAGMTAYWYWSRTDSVDDLPEPGPGVVEFEVYFGNYEKDPEGLQCDLVFPVKRTQDETTAVAAYAVKSLLEGPSAEEKAQGYFTWIHPRARLLGISLEGGIATVDFSSEFEEDVAGSCQVRAIWSQLRNTLLQFDKIQDVRIMVQGRASTALQP